MLTTTLLFIYRACTVCRRLKMKCVGAENGPPCKRCITGKHECIFEESNRGKRSSKKNEVLTKSIKKMEMTLETVMKSLKNPALTTLITQSQTGSSAPPATGVDGPVDSPRSRSASPVNRINGARHHQSRLGMMDSPLNVVNGHIIHSPTSSITPTTRSPLTSSKSITSSVITKVADSRSPSRNPAHRTLSMSRGPLSPVL